MTLKKQISTYWNSSFEKARGVEMKKYGDKIKIEGYPNYTFPDVKSAKEFLDKASKIK